MDAQTSTVKPAPADPGGSERPARDRLGLLRPRTTRPRTDHAAGDDGLVALGYLLSGIGFYGGLGWLGWHHLGQVWMFPLGLVLGMAAGLYLVVKRYSPTTATVDTTTEKEQ